MQPDRLALALDHDFARPELLVQALTHRSYGSPHNERLEFLGDAILNCIVATLLFDRFPAIREGELSRQRANLVKQDTLAEIANRLKLGEFLRLGEGELKSGGFRRPSILADCLEAILGAIYLDAGFAAAYGVVEKLYGERLAEVDPKLSSKDAKTELQEKLQARKLPLPQYTLLATRGDAHEQEFEVECQIPTLSIATQGVGPSRRHAEQAAARSAIEQMSRS
jgi:ribonuclease III